MASAKLSEALASMVGMSTKRLSPDRSLPGPRRLRAARIRMYERASATHGVVAATMLGSKRQRRALRHGELTRVHRGVHRFRAARDTFEARALAATLAASKRVGSGYGKTRGARVARAAASHRTGAYAYGLDGGSATKIEVLCARWDRSHHHGVKVHEMRQFDENDIRDVDGLSVVVPELVVLQFSGMRWTSVDFIERMIYQARRKRLLSVDSLERYLAHKARKGRPGVRKLRAALAKARRHEMPPESDPESLLLQACRARGLGEPSLQYELAHNGRRIGRFDGAFVDIKVLFEYQSMEWHQNEEELAAANDRRLAAFEAGWFVLEARWWDLKHGGHKFAAAVRAARTRTRTSNRVPASSSDHI
jgi:hypothetical protein